MNVSFEVLSSMSPKIKRPVKPVKKLPTTLALKKYLKRCSIKNESIITIDSDDDGVVSVYDKDSDVSPLVISDSEPSRTSPVKNCTTYRRSDKNDKSDKQLSQDNYKLVKHWVDEVNKLNYDCSIFSEVSTICEDNQIFKTTSANAAASSTLLVPNSKRFDERFRNNKQNSPDSDCQESTTVLSKKYCSYAVDVVGDSLINDDKSTASTESLKNASVIDDSLELQLNESFNTRLGKLNAFESSEPVASQINNDDCEHLLDSLYGKGWRKNKDDILPSSEPHRRKNKICTAYETPPKERASGKMANVYVNPYVDNNKDDNLLKSLQKAKFKRTVESPWVNVLKTLCDLDESTDNLKPTRLQFDDDDSIKENKLSADLNRKPKTKIQPKVSLFDDGNSLKESKLKDATLEHSTKSQTKVNGKISTRKLPLNPHHNNTASGCCSFLASLSGTVPVLKSDMTALIYRNNFKQNREELTRKLFSLYNEQIFKSSIPEDTPMEWNDRMIKTAGYCYCRRITRRTGKIERAARIVLSSKILDSADRLRDTLVHEMCHAATWIVNQVTDGHGRFWKSWANRAMATFPELPPIKRCHQYVINTKYTYKCVGCGYSVGRHTKSLDTERKRCGYCYGQFEVLINKTDKKGTVKSVPVTPKKPVAGFALFVKDNYATYKTPNMKHGDVMNLLGQKFSNLKVD